MKDRHPLAVSLAPHGGRPYRTRDRLAVVGALARPLVAVDRGGRVRPLKLALGDVPGRDFDVLGGCGEILHEIGDRRPSHHRVDTPSISGDHARERGHISLVEGVGRGAFVADDGFLRLRVLGPRFADPGTEQHADNEDACQFHCLIPSLHR